MDCMIFRVVPFCDMTRLVPLNGCPRNDVSQNVGQSNKCFLVEQLLAQGTYPWIKEQIQLFMEQNLILLISQAEVLQELVSQTH